MLEVLKERLQNAIRKITRKGYIDEKTISEFIKDVERGLLLSDVRVEDVLEISKKIKKRVQEEKILPGLTKREHLIKVVYEELVQLLGGVKPEIRINKGSQTKIMLVGLQGSGKTTTAAKLAYFFKNRGYKVGVVCADVYREGAQEQLRELSRMAEVDFLETSSKNVMEIVKEGERKFSGRDVIIFDTAGRHRKEGALLREMKEISKVIKPNMIFLIVDATIGQQAYSQAKAFHETVPVGGIIVTKMDGTARGGGALSATIATGAKIYFIGTGERLEDLEPYDPKGFVSRLLGLGDIKSLIEKVERLEKKKEVIKRAEKIISGRFTLEDFVKQIEDMRKLGSFGKILELLPIPIFKVPTEKIMELDAKAKKWRYALDSMTDYERANPKIIDSKRIRRISRGAGLDEREVKELLKQYHLVRKAMRTKGKRFLKILKRGYKV
ncbi:signal recognition particle protein [Candidatus Geothermarchaeota archaeon]|nr:MAG: signal recognition particle protein [Candidatus Geothermarchaeota archaeon]